MTDSIYVSGSIKKAHWDDAAWDIFSTIDVDLAPGSTALIPCGGVIDGRVVDLKVQLPVGTVACVCSRSGLAAKNSVAVLNAPGIIDAGFEGTINVILHNFHPTETFTVTQGQRIAQLMFLEVSSKGVVGDHVVVGDSVRGSGGFGSSGTH